MADLSRSTAEVDREGARLQSVAKDYGSWDDIFEFAAHPDTKFVADNFTLNTFQNLSYDFVVILDTNREVLAGAARSADGKTLVRPSQELIDAVRKNLTPGSPLASSRGGHGIVAHSGGWAVVGICPILDSQDRGPSRGSLAFGRLMDDDLLGEIALHSDLKLELAPWNPSAPLPRGFERWRPSAPAAEVVALDRWTAFSRVAVPDLSGHPSFWLVARKDLKSYPRAVASVRTFSVLLVFFGLAAAAIILGGLRRHVVARIESLQRAALQVGLNPDSIVQFNDSQTDEIGALAGSVDSMVAKLRRVAADLKAGEERLRHVLDATNEGIWDWDLRSDRIIYSVRWAAMLGLEHSQLEGTPAEWFDRVHPDDRKALTELIRAHLEGVSEVLRMEYRIRDAAGAYRWVFCRGLATRDSSGKPIRFAGSQTDITDRRVAQEQLLQDALYDKLTGLANRALFLDSLGRCLRKGARHPEHKFAVLYLDLDHFKNINDSLGHLAGDEMLRQFGERLRHCVRDGDLVGRLSGDEFVILADDLANTASIHPLALRILAEVTKPFHVAGGEFFIGTSIGVALSQPHYEKAEDILRDADTALYQAKAQGRGQYALFDTAMRDLAMERLDLDTDLRRALERDEFFLVYQPIVALADGMPVGVEALVRWQHPVRGLVSPGAFIPLAEETGLIVAIGEWVLRKACGDLARWADLLGRTSGFTMAVNVSTRQFRQPDLASLVRSVIGETGIPASRLKLEITESVLMEDPQLAAITIDQIRQTGASISLDDFGTGFSSLSYLQRFDIDTLKIDGSFVKDLGNGTKNDGIIRALVVLAESLQVPIVVEGVETDLQRDTLRRMGCQCAQGFLFARPMKEEQLLAYLADVFAAKD